MTNFIEHLSSKIMDIASTKATSKELSDDQKLENTLEDIQTYLSQMGLNQEIINDFQEQITQFVNEGMQNGKSFDDSFTEAFEFSNSVLKQAIQSEPKISSEDPNKYDLNFANASLSANTLLIDQAIAKGMTVEEAIKYVNNQQVANSEIFGPEKNNANENFNDSVASTSMSKEEISLSKIEADMDAQASSRFNEDIEEDELIKDSDSDKSQSIDEDDLG